MLLSVLESRSYYRRDSDDYAGMCNCWFAGTDLTRRFHDQFIPMIIDKETQLASSDSTVIRMPLSAKFMNELETGGNRLTKIFDSLIHQASSTLLFLKSVLQVCLLVHP